MFFGGPWYKDTKRECALLQEKLMLLLREKKALQRQLSDSKHSNMFNSDAQHAFGQLSVLAQNGCKLQVLCNALRELGYDHLSAGGDICHLQSNDSDDVCSAANRNRNNNNRKHVIDLTAAGVAPHATLQPTIAADKLRSQQPPMTHMDVDSAQQQHHQQHLHAHDAEINDAMRVYPGQTQPCVSSYLRRNKVALVEELTKKYELAMCTLSQRRRRRQRTPMERRIYHIDPDLTARDLSQRNDSQHQLMQGVAGAARHGHGHAHGHHPQLPVERYWMNTIDEALQSYVDGDVLELCEGRHVMCGSVPICGTLTIRGVAKSNWKTLIENKCDSTHFIWCIGKDSRINLENVLLRQCGSHAGIVRLSLRAQLTAKNAIFHCNALEGFYLEHESKLWLDHCVVLNSVGAAIHINTGCKCLLTCSNIVHCGESDEHVVSGQGAIVIYGTDVNYAEHLVRQTPSLRFPSMDNVPRMVLSPDPILASMLRGRTYLYVQECKIKSNYGFGISFEVTTAFHGLPVPCIASMMDVSITVRETHFNDNVFGNMGKIPAHWVQHAQGQQAQLFAWIRKINPAIFHHDGGAGEADHHLYADAAEADAAEVAMDAERERERELEVVLLRDDDDDNKNGEGDECRLMDAEFAAAELAEVDAAVAQLQNEGENDMEGQMADDVEQQQQQQNEQQVHIDQVHLEDEDEDDDVLIMDAMNVDVSAAPPMTSHLDALEAEARETFANVHTMDPETAARAYIERQGFARSFEDTLSLSSGTGDSDRSSILAATGSKMQRRKRLPKALHVRCRSEPIMPHHSLLLRPREYAHSSCPVEMDRIVTQCDEFRAARLLQQQQEQPSMMLMSANQMQLQHVLLSTATQKPLPAPAHALNNPIVQDMMDMGMPSTYAHGKQEMDMDMDDVVDKQEVQSPPRSDTRASVPCLASRVMEDDTLPPSPLRRSPRIRNKLQQQQQLEMQVQMQMQSMQHHNSHRQLLPCLTTKTKRAVKKKTNTETLQQHVVSNVKKRKRVARNSSANKQCKQRDTAAPTTTTTDTQTNENHNHSAAAASGSIQDTPGCKNSDKENDSERSGTAVFVENTAVTLPSAKRRKLSHHRMSEGMVFPELPSTTESSQTQDIEVNAPETEHPFIPPETPMLRRSTRKASLKASQALMAKTHRNADKKKVLSQPSADASTEGKPQSKRRARRRRNSAV